MDTQKQEYRTCKLCNESKVIEDFPASRYKCKLCYNKYRVKYNLLVGRTKMEQN